MRKNKAGLGKNTNNSTLAIVAGSAVVFMFIMTIVAVFLYQKNILEVANLTKEANFKKFDYYVAYITSDDSNDYYASVYESARTQGIENGVYVDMLSDSINEEYTKYELMEMAIDADCDGIIVEGDTSEELAYLIKKASNKGILVITIQNDVPDSNRISYVGVNNYSIAQLYASELSTSINENTEVVIFEGAREYESSTGILVTGIQEAVAQKLNEETKVNYSIITIDDEDAFATEEYVQEYFQADELPDVIICLDELCTTCVYQALIDYNKVGDVALLGYYQSGTIFEGIKRGVIKSTVSIDTVAMGKSAVDAFCEYKETGYSSDYYGVDSSLITRYNISKYTEEVESEKN